jgi:hypothetical protein
MMEAARTSETLVNFYDRRENLESYLRVVSFPPVEYTYFTNNFFAIFHTSFAFLSFITETNARYCCKADHTTLHKPKNNVALPFVTYSPHGKVSETA